MRLALRPGTYVVAVSGGVDSMVLVELLRKLPQIKLIIAHADHGTRDDTALDKELVTAYAKSHNILYETINLHLGKGVSEQQAREARYKFLRHCRDKYATAAILTAHHQDDMLETAMINLMRGTGWRGLAPFVTNNDVVRPLLNYTKKDILAYARTHKLTWREDSTNNDQSYLRNYIRHTIIPLCDKRDAEWRESFLQHIRNQRILCRTIQTNCENLLNEIGTHRVGSISLRRYYLITLPRSVALECTQLLFRMYTGHSLERPQAEAVLVFAKVARHGKLMPINSHWQCRTTLDSFIVEPRSLVIS